MNLKISTLHFPNICPFKQEASFFYYSVTYKKKTIVEQ